MRHPRNIVLMLIAGISTCLVAGGPQIVDAAYAKPDLGAGAIVPADAQPEMLWEGGTWLEAPAVAPTGEVYFSDIIEVRKPGKLGVIRVYDPKTRQTRLFRSPSHGSNGLLFDADGRLLTAHGAAFGGRYITRTDMVTNMSEIVAGLYNGRAFNAPNDMALDRKGRIYFTDPRYNAHEPIEQPVMGVYRVDPDGRVHLLISDLARPNGIAISADEKRLYVVEADPEFPRHANDAPSPPSSGRVRVLGYDLADDGTVSNKQIVITYDSQKIAVDGIKTDRDGNLYITELSEAPGIRVLAPSGNPVAFIATPEMPINLTFARADGIDWLYFTTATRLYRLRVKIPGA